MNKLIPFLSFVLLLCQCQEVHENDIDFKKLINQDWIRSNPSISATKASFFNDENQDTYLMFEVDFDGSSAPFSRDCDLSTLSYLSKHDKNISSKNKSFKKLNYLEVEITYDEELSALICFENEIYHTEVKDWFLTDYFDCPETISFPRVKFEKMFDLPNPITNSQKGLAILPFDHSIEKITKSSIELLSDKNEALKGTGYDINKDQINDIFIYNEEIEESIEYKRLYVNVNGTWICKWIEYYQDCL